MWEKSTKVVLELVLGTDPRLKGIIDTIALVTADAAARKGVINPEYVQLLVSRLI